MEAEIKEKGTFQPLQVHFLPWNPICVPNPLIRHDIVIEFMIVGGAKCFSPLVLFHFHS